MCQVNNVLHNTGSKPLICYKVLSRAPGSIRSPYFSQCSWQLGKTKCSKPLCFHQGCIGYGFFHAFTNETDAYREQEEWMRLYPYDDYIVAEMEIPSHTNYYTGTTKEGINSIATPVITFKQIL